MSHGSHGSPGHLATGPMSHLGVSHSPQLSTPATGVTRPHQTPTKVSAAADFFEGISHDMSSTSRGPLTKLNIEKVNIELCIYKVCHVKNIPIQLK